MLKVPSLTWAVKYLSVNFEVEPGKCRFETKMLLSFCYVGRSVTTAFPLDIRAKIVTKNSCVEILKISGYFRPKSVYNIKQNCQQRWVWEKPSARKEEHSWNYSWNAYDSKHLTRNQRLYLYIVNVLQEQNGWYLYPKVLSKHSKI